MSRSKATPKDTRQQRLEKIEQALDRLAAHARNLCEHIGTATPHETHEKNPLWSLLEKDAALAQKLLALLGGLLTQEKRLGALQPAAPADSEEVVETIDWAMLEAYFHRRREGTE